MNMYLFTGMRGDNFGPEFQAADCLPAVDFPEGVLGLHAKGSPEKHSQLPDVAKGMFVCCRSVKAKELDHAGGHEAEMWRVSGVYKFGIDHKRSVGSLHQNLALALLPLTSLIFFT